MATDLRRLSDIDIKAAASTRLLIYAAKMIQSGCPINKAYQYCIVEPLSDEPETINALKRVISAYC
ncbi:CbbQ/NirQ/NorQ C-terminal domain-containing protein [Colwellia maritima]|uniref:CbbQ/NirQ/NorQ domain-containing protein n=1 Tax=Colwellia maritima TaxID=2912588 RepID=UPI00237AE36E|nr:CbbQ/NirQ/NorQ C-terminal domain-containing protein [Colwellia maritima]